jgi:hypothetical protein
MRINAPLAIVYMIAGRKREPQRILEGMDSLELRGDRDFSMSRASIYAKLGDNEQAFLWLEKAYTKRVPRMMFELKVSPAYEKLRDDPSIGDLVQPNRTAAVNWSK